MSKLMDEMHARYDHPAPRKSIKKPPAPAARPRILVSPPARRPAQTPSAPSPQAMNRPPAKHRHRDVEGLRWTIFEGVEVLRLGDSNYVAVPDERHTFTIYRIEPRTSVHFRLKQKELLGEIKRLIQRDEERRETERKFSLKKKAEEAEDERRKENQPGFYVTPGEEDPDDVESLLPIGPFWRFGLAGPRYTAEDINDDHLGDDDAEDWALEAWKAEREKPAGERLPVTIIEARNLREAEAGKGCVWWKDGVFRGPPADPRQAGFGW